MISSAVRQHLDKLTAGWPGWSGRWAAGQPSQCTTGNLGNPYWQLEMTRPLSLWQCSVICLFPLCHRADTLQEQASQGASLSPLSLARSPICSGYALSYCCHCVRRLSSVASELKGKTQAANHHRNQRLMSRSNKTWLDEWKHRALTLWAVFSSGL